MIGCVYGTIDFEETAELEKFSLSQASDFKRCTAGGQDLDSERVRQEGKRRFLSALFLCHSRITVSLLHFAAYRMKMLATSYPGIWFCTLSEIPIFTVAS